jgi:uncharacterized protein
VPFHSNTAAFFRENIEFPFFQYYLKGKGSPSFPEAWVFETGTNQWRRFDAWPPRNLKRRSLFLHPQGGLALDSPPHGDSQPFDEYTSDPARPVEYLDKIEIGMTGDYMIQDQRIASRRPDVLVYASGDLKQDLTIAGPIDVRLFVSTSGTDSDWVVKLIDVYPDDYPTPGPGNAPTKLGGYQQLVRGDVMRGKFRNSLSKPEPFVPGQATPVNFTLQDVAHTFRTGHKVMVQIQSSWFPIVDRNPQKFVDIYNAQESDFQPATQRVYHTSEMPSHLEVLEVAH